jgi:hypothetical protein
LVAHEAGLAIRVVHAIHANRSSAFLFVVVAVAIDAIDLSAVLAGASAMGFCIALSALVVGSPGIAPVTARAVCVVNAILAGERAHIAFLITGAAVAIPITATNTRAIRARRSDSGSSAIGLYIARFTSACLRVAILAV